MEDIKNIGLPSKAVLILKSCLKEKDLRQFDDKQNANTFKNFYSKLASDLVVKIRTGKKGFGENSVEKYYSPMNISSNPFKFRKRKGWKDL